jgi:hydroxypyruvate reductase
MQGAADVARRLGYAVEVIADPVVGEARVAGAQLARAALERARALPKPACVIASGETTVHVVGNGRGGRNQEMTLAAAEVLAAAGGTAAFASIGTDGIDGPTNAAGAMADALTLDRARAAGLGAPSAYLDANNAYAWFERLGDLVVTGPTGTNVGDLQLFLLA